MRIQRDLAGGVFPDLKFQQRAGRALMRDADRDRIEEAARGLHGEAEKAKVADVLAPAELQAEIGIRQAAERATDDADRLTVRHSRTRVADIASTQGEAGEPAAHIDAAFLRELYEAAEHVRRQHRCGESWIVDRVACLRHRAFLPLGRFASLSMPFAPSLVMRRPHKTASIPAAEFPIRHCLTVFAIALALAGCGESLPPAPAGDASHAPTLQQLLLDAKPGDIVEIPAGRLAFNRSLTLRASGLTIRGAGMHKGVLSFKGHKAGAEALLVIGDDFLI